MITLILADDHPVFASGLRAVFDASGTGARHAALAVQEWEVLAIEPQRLPSATAGADERCDAH